MNDTPRMDPSELPEPGKCVVCEQQTLMPNGSTNHLECSPVDRKLCLGCFMFLQEVKLFALRGADCSMWDAEAAEAGRLILLICRQGGMMRRLAAFEKATHE